MSAVPATPPASTSGKPAGPTVTTTTGPTDTGGPAGTSMTGPACATAGPRRPSLLRHPLASFFSQFGLPSGPLGHVAGWIMARENVRLNELVVGQLGIGPDDRVLEVGCGPGVALAAAQRRAGRGFVAGVDPSAIMVKQASRRLRGAVRAGSAELRRAGAEALPYPDASFTRAFTVNTIDHWESVPDGLAELSRVLAPGARLSIALRRQRADAGRDPHGQGASASDIAELRDRLESLGFAGITVADHDLGREILAIVSARRA
jgi:SAM-dependent methyltransferase